MKSYSSEEIQDISANFRNVARRLSRTDYSQCDANLKRFISVVDSEELIQKFIIMNNVHTFDIEELITKRNWISPFEISHVKEEEISLEYQMLKYSVEKFDGDFTRLYGTHWYTNAKSNTNDEMKRFINHIIDPFIDFISEHLRITFDKRTALEQKDKPQSVNGITANYSTVVVANNIEGRISNNVNINEEVKTDAIDLVNSIKDIFSSSMKESDSDILELLNQIELDISENNKPKKGFFTALKTLCGGSATAISLVNALIQLFGYM